MLFRALELLEEIALLLRELIRAQGGTPTTPAAPPIDPRRP